MAKADIVVGQSTYNEIAVVRFDTPTGGTADFYYEGFAPKTTDIKCSFTVGKKVNINIAKPDDKITIDTELIMEV